MLPAMTTLLHSQTAQISQANSVVEAYTMLNMNMTAMASFCGQGRNNLLICAVREKHPLDDPPLAVIGGLFTHLPATPSAQHR